MAGVQSPPLVATLEGHTDVVNCAFYVKSVEAIISGSNDSTFGIWLRRDNGQYWPSVWQQMNSPVTAMAWAPADRRLFVGLDTGHIMMYQVSEDFNRVTLKHDFAAHKARVTAIVLDLAGEHLFSVGLDQCFQWFCSEDGTHRGGYNSGSQASALAYDPVEKRAFVGDFQGNIKVLSLKNDRIALAKTMSGHQEAGGFMGPIKDFALGLLRGTVRSLAWDPKTCSLFAGAFNNSVIQWRPNSEEKPLYAELAKHTSRVRAVCWLPNHERLLSCAGTDVYQWDFSAAANRLEAPAWEDDKVCAACSEPFYFHFFKEWDYKKISAKRKHHCRHCGKSFCANCSAKETAIPRMGLEDPVRVCEDCFIKVTDEDKRPLTLLYTTTHEVVNAQWMEEVNWLVTCGADKTIKIWNYTDFLGQ